MKNYLETYARKTPKFQMGGEMDPGMGADPNMGEPGMGAPEQGGAPDIEGMLMEFAQTQDPNLAVAICNGILEAMGGAPEGQPMMRRGGRLQTQAPIFRKGGKLL